MHLERRVLVTGGAGFLGSHLCERLLEQRCQLLCVDNFCTGARYHIEHLLDDKQFELERHDITHPLFVEVDEIDQVNILQATLNGMQRAVEKLEPAPQRVVIDGNQAPRLSCEVKTIIGGDRLIASISAASVLAKVYRDRLMKSMHLLYPEYGFDRHKGYPTAHHLDRLRALGPCPIHRKSFAPVRAAYASIHGVSWQ